MEISFINDEYSNNLDEALNFAHKNGLRYIELRRINNRDITEFTADELAQMSVKISSAGILVSAIASPFLLWAQGQTGQTILGSKTASEIDYFNSLMDIADIFGAPNIRIYSYSKQKDIDLDNLGKTLDIYSQMALDRGISLLLENNVSCNINTISKMHQLFELYGFSNIFPLLNIGATLSMNDDYKIQDLQDLINKCLYFHLQDYDADLKRQVVIGEGNVDYEVILAEKIYDKEVIFSLNTATSHPEDLQMSLNLLQTWEID